MKQRRWLVIIVLIVTAIYMASYAYVRHEKLLIHRSSHVGQLTHHHEITSGDFIGISSAARYGRISSWVFAPLRWAETRYWYLRHPVGQPWPYS